jgi:hypothetical protein
VQPGNVLVYDGAGRWSIRPEVGSEERLLELTWRDIRFSVSWKAYCFADERERETWRLHADDLSLDRILEVLAEDLRRRGVLAAGERPGDHELALRLIDTYEHYPEPQPAG